MTDKQEKHTKKEEEKEKNVTTAEAANNEDATENLESVEYATIQFAFPMSRHESEEIIKHPNGKVMKNFMAYMKKVVMSAAKKYAEVPAGETVTDCKVPIA